MYYCKSYLSTTDPWSSAEQDSSLSNTNKIVLEQGFDEYMNLVLDDAVELDLKQDKSEKLGRILLKGDTISLLTAAPR